MFCHSAHLLPLTRFTEVDGRSCDQEYLIALVIISDFSLPLFTVPNMARKKIEKNDRNTIWLNNDLVLN